LHLSKGQLVDVEDRLQTRQWDDDAGKGLYRSVQDSLTDVGIP